MLLFDNFLEVLEDLGGSGRPVGWISCKFVRNATDGTDFWPKNKQANEYWLKLIPEKFDKIDYLKNMKISLNTKDVCPIFIVGLPRCGSTLIESIISSGQDTIENLGETNLVNWSFLNTNRNIFKS